MQLFSLTVCLWLALLHQVYPSPTPGNILDKRAACNADTLLNALRAANHLSYSYSFCRAYISIPPTSMVMVYTVRMLAELYQATPLR